jgi:hypothetical protein
MQTIVSSLESFWILFSTEPETTTRDISSVRLAVQGVTYAQRNFRQSYIKFRENRSSSSEVEMGQHRYPTRLLSFLKESKQANIRTERVDCDTEITHEVHDNVAR